MLDRITQLFQDIAHALVLTAEEIAQMYDPGFEFPSDAEIVIVRRSGEIAKELRKIQREEIILFKMKSDSEAKLAEINSEIAKLEEKYENC